MSKHEDQILALAGMFQAGHIIRQIAHSEPLDPAAYEASIQSIFNNDVLSTEAVYGGTAGVTLGLSILKTIFDKNHKQRDLEIARYVFGITSLEKKLRQNTRMLDSLRIGIDRCQLQADIYTPIHENVIANLADVYKETISQLKPKIIVAGDQSQLSHAVHANKVRTLLLALMRSAVLWRQKGGKRWQLIFSREKIMQKANAYLLSGE